MTKHIVTYYLPGSFFPETYTQVIDARSPQLASQIAPARAFCFTLHELPDEVPEIEGYTVTPKPVNMSGRYYLGGDIYTLSEVEAMDGMDTMARNMRSNGWSNAIRTRAGNWQPFLDEDEQILMVTA